MLTLPKNYKKIHGQFRTYQAHHQTIYDLPKTDSPFTQHKNIIVRVESPFHTSYYAFTIYLFNINNIPFFYTDTLV